MLLVIADIGILKKAALNYIIQVKKCCYFMPAYITKVVRTLASDRQISGLQIFRDGNSVIILI